MVDPDCYAVPSRDLLMEMFHEGAISQRPFMALSQPPTRRAEGYAKKPFSENESMFPGLAFLPSEDIVLCHTLGGLRLCFTITDSLFHQFSKTNSCYFFLRLIEKN